MLKPKKLQYHSNKGEAKQKEKERGEGKEEKEKKQWLHSQFGYFGDSFWPKKLLGAKGQFWR